MWTKIAVLTGGAAIKLAKPFIIKALVKYIYNQERTDWVIDQINKKVNLPKLSEFEEQKLIGEQVRLIQNVIVEMIKKY